MKKIIVMFFAVLLALSLAACTEREYPTDGVFLGYEVGVSRNAPMVTFVTVTIEDDEITAYDINVRQGSRTGDGAEVAYAYAWNQQTKKELGFEYHLHYTASGATTTAEYTAWLTANNKLEWFQQAELIEAFWLENGIEAMHGDEETAIDNVAGVTIKNAYSVAAQHALDNAKAGKFLSIYCSGSDLYIGEMTLTSKGAIETLVVDVLQRNRAAAAGTFEWNTQTKQQLGYAYGMHKTASGTSTEADYIAWLTANNKLEWFEQANLITEDIIENGWSSSAAENVPAGVSISTAGYYAVLAALFGFAGDAVK